MQIYKNKTDQIPWIWTDLWKVKVVSLSQRLYDELGCSCDEKVIDCKHIFGIKHLVLYKLDILTGL